MKDKKKGYTHIPEVDHMQAGAFLGPLVASAEGKSVEIVSKGLTGTDIDADILRMPINKKIFVNHIDVTVKYINYFIKYFDPEEEVISAYMMLSWAIRSKEHNVDLESFLDLLEHSFSTPSLLKKFKAMIDVNMEDKSLDPPKGKPTTDSIQITEGHYRAMMMLSVIYKVVLPIASTYYHLRKNLLVMDGMPVGETDFYYYCFTRFVPHIDEIYDVDLYTKLYNTASTRVAKRQKNVDMWERRKVFGGKTKVGQQSDLMRDLFVNIAQKAVFQKNIINFIHAVFDSSIRNLLIQKDKYDVVTIKEEKESENEESANKFENIQMAFARHSLQDKSRAEQRIQVTIRDLCTKYNIVITDEMIDFYKKRFRKSKGVDKETYRISSDIQINMIYLFFAKHAGSFSLTNYMKTKWFIQLIILFKEIYQLKGFTYLPALVSGDIDPISSKRFNKRQLEKQIIEHPDYDELKEEYEICGNQINRDKLIDSLRNLVTNKVYMVDHRYPDETGVIDTDNPNYYQYVANEIVKFLLDL